MKTNSRLYRALRSVRRQIKLGRNVIAAVEKTWRKYHVNRHALWTNLQLSLV